jgi:Meiotically Up-regulated Gene 113 (MUG113) protein
VNSPDCLYFIQCGDDGPIKIGVSHDPSARLRALQTASPYPLTLLWVHGPLEDAPGLELRLHKRHAAIRLQGEWFLPTDGLLNHIFQMRAVEEEIDPEEAAA